MSFDWKSIVSTIAPVLGVAIGGPFGGIASKVIQNALGVSTEAEMIEEIQHNPEALLLIKQADQTFTIKMEELGIQKDQLLNVDRAGARKLAIEKGIVFQAFLTLVFMAGYFSLFWLFFSGETQPLNDWQRGQVGVLIGVLTGAIPQLLSFWFGTSKSSSDKNSLIAGRKV